MISISSSYFNDILQIPPLCIFKYTLWLLFFVDILKACSVKVCQELKKYNPYVIFEWFFTHFFVFCFCVGGGLWIGFRFRKCQTILNHFMPWHMYLGTTYQALEKCPFNRVGELWLRFEFPEVVFGDCAKKHAVSPTGRAWTPYLNW